MIPPPLPPPAPRIEQSAEPRNAASSRDVVLLIVAILFPLIGLVFLLVTRSQAHRRGQQNSQMSFVSLVISIVLTVLSVIAFVIGFVILGTVFSQHSGTHSSEYGIAEEDAAMAENVIVLRAEDAKGSILGGSNASDTSVVLSHRLERAGISFKDITVNHEQIYVIFDDEADPATVMSAAEHLAGEFRLDMRRVVDAEECTSPAVGSYEDTDGHVVACDREGREAYTMGPVVISGDSIVDVVAVDGQSGGQWYVNFTLDADGTREFADVTSELTEEEWPQNMLAVVLDGEVISAPQVRAALTDGEAVIAGGFDQRIAESLALELKLASRGLFFTVESAKVRQ